MRRGQEQQLSGTGLVLSDSEVRELNGILTATYQGTDVDRGRRTRTYVSVTGKAVLTFYYEAIGLSDAEFGPRAAEVFRHIELK